MEVAEGYNDLAGSFYGALMTWTWWQRGELRPLEPMFRDVIAQAPARLPHLVGGAGAHPRRGGDSDQAMADLEALADIGWEVVAKDQTEGVSLALAAAACGVLGAGTGTRRARVRADAALRGDGGGHPGAGGGCAGPADHYLGLLAAPAATRPGRSALRGGVPPGPPHGLAALRSGGRGGAGRTLRQRGREGEEERVAVLLRNAEETAMRWACTGWPGWPPADDRRDRRGGRPVEAGGGSSSSS